MTRSRGIFAALLAFALLIGGAAGCAMAAAADEPAPNPAPQTVADPAPAAPAAQTPPKENPPADAVDPDVDRVLKLTEKAGETTQLIKADFEYHMNETMIDENEWRIGRMVYRKPSEIFIEFTEGKLNESFRFDGRIYVEDRPRQRQRLVHILRKASDPPVSILDVDQLPFPHPFGGKRETLLKNYTVTYKGKQKLEPWQRPGITPADAKPPETEFEHLELVPKPGSNAAKNYTKVEFWIDPADGLLRQVRTVDKSERILTMRFKNVQVNDTAGKVDAKTFEAGKLPDGWDQSITDHTEE